jgi:tight adherence protein B
MGGMKWLIMLLFLFSSFLFFMYVFQRLFLTNKKMDKRIKYYLSLGDKQGLDRKKFNILLEMQLHMQSLGQQMKSKKGSSKLEQKLKRAGMPFKPEEYVFFRWISTLLGGGILYLITGDVLFLLIGFVSGYLLPGWWITKKQRDRLNRFNQALPDMITTIIGSLRAGFSFVQSLKAVVDESDSPMKEEIETVLKEMQYGSSIDDALQELKERMPSEDLELMIQAILIQKQVGGNLATILDTIVQTIRDRNKIQRQIVTLTAQGRLSGIVIGLLPIVLGMLIYLIEPDYIGSLFRHPVGMMMLVGSVISGIIGFVLIRKITTIEV